MPSSLFNAMSSSNGNFMINSMLSGLRDVNPNAYAQLQGIVQSGGEEQAIHNLVKQLSPQQVSQFKSIANMCGINESKIDSYLK